MCGRVRPHLWRSYHKEAVRQPRPTRLCSLIRPKSGGAGRIVAAEGERRVLEGTPVSIYVHQLIALNIKQLTMASADFIGSTKTGYQLYSGCKDRRVPEAIYDLKVIGWCLPKTQDGDALMCGCDGLLVKRPAPRPRRQGRAAGERCAITPQSAYEKTGKAP